MNFETVISAAVIVVLLIFAVIIYKVNRDPSPDEQLLRDNAKRFKDANVK